MLFWDLLESVWCCAACNSGLCFICFELMSIIRTLLVLFLFSVGLSRASPAVWGCHWQVLDRRGQVLGRLGLSWAGLGRVLGGSWAEVGVSRAGLGLLG